MSERHQEQIGETPAPKAQWKPPMVDRLVSGNAEIAGDSSSDGSGTLS